MNLEKSDLDLFLRRNDSLQTSRGSKKISQNLYGICLENLNFSFAFCFFDKICTLCLCSIRQMFVENGVIIEMQTGCSDSMLWTQDGN